jgi:hypothetical protein
MSERVLGPTSAVGIIALFCCGFYKLYVVNFWKREGNDRKKNVALKSCKIVVTLQQGLLALCLSRALFNLKIIRY